MKEVRLHGRGGQGVVVAAEFLASALALEGNYVASFPMFGFERRGAPLIAYLRFDDCPIREKTQVYAPECLIITDPVLGHSPAVFQGFQEGGIVLLNSSHPLEERPNPRVGMMGVVNATDIALRELGIPATNTAMAGAFAATTGWVSLEHILEAIEGYWSGDILAKNRACARRGYEEVKVVRFKEG